MRAFFALLAVVAAAVGVAACGGSSGGSSGSGSSLTLNAYRVRGNEEPGYKAERPVDYKTTQALEVKGNAQFTVGEERRLNQEGFRGAAVEGTGGQGGLSMVYELGSASAAERELQAEVNEDLHAGAGESVERFAVPAIPGAVGIAYPGSGSGNGGNVLFREGRCYLIVGDLDKAKDYRAPAIAGATAIWKRTSAKSGACST